MAAPTLTTSSSEARTPMRPELAHVFLRGVAGVVGDKGERLAGRAQGAQSFGHAGDHRVLDPHATVEVEQHVVIGGEQGSEGRH